MRKRFAFLLICLTIISGATTAEGQRHRRARHRRTQANSNTQPQGKKAEEKSAGPINADSRTKIYYWPNCPDFNRVPAEYKVVFGTGAEAEKNGYKPAKNCP